MKRLPDLMMAAVLLLSLSACSCSHEWREAGCETPKTCAKCGETEDEALGHEWIASSCETPETCSRCAETRGEAMGHDWVAATCADPETCTRCGNTQGEAADHAYGEWIIAESTMTRTCGLCGAEETTPYSEEAYAQQLMIGHWDFYVLFYDGTVADPYRQQDAYVAYSAEAGADGTFRLWVGDDKEHALRWEYAAHDPEKDIYTFTMIREDTQGQLKAYLQPMKEGVNDGVIQLMLPFAEGMQIFLFQDPRLEEGFVGTWQGAGDNADCVLKLAADHTFTGDVDGQVSGTWYLRPLKMYHETYHYVGITLRGTRGEELFEHFVLIALWGDPAEYDVVEEIQRTGYFSLTLQEDGSKVDFRRVRE